MTQVLDASIELEAGGPPPCATEPNDEKGDRCGDCPVRKAAAKRMENTRKMLGVVVDSTNKELPVVASAWSGDAVALATLATLRAAYYRDEATFWETRIGYCAGPKVERFFGWFGRQVVRCQNQGVSAARRRIDVTRL